MVHDKYWVPTLYESRVFFIFFKTENSFFKLFSFRVWAHLFILGSWRFYLVLRIMTDFQSLWWSPSYLESLNFFHSLNFYCQLFLNQSLYRIETNGFRFLLVLLCFYIITRYRLSKKWQQPLQSYSFQRL